MADKNELTALGLKDEINANHRECLKAGNATIQYAIQAGGLLTKVKALVPHGEFQKWVDQFCDFSYDVAAGYMRLQKELGTFSKVERAQLLTDATSITSLKKLLKPRENATSAPKTPPPSGKRDSEPVTDCGPSPPANQTSHIDDATWTDPLDTPEPPVMTSPPAKPNGTPPRQLDRPAYYKQWDQMIGPIVRLVDKIALGVGETGCHDHKLVQDRLNLATETMMEWMGVDQ